MRQAGILAAAGIYALDNMILRLEEDHDNAKELAASVSKISSIDIDVSKVSTNLIFFKLKNKKYSDKKFINELIKHNIKIDSKGNRLFRMVTHSGFSNNDIGQVAEAFKLILMK